MPAIFTIGHSNHAIERFLELLKRHAIEELADIRRFPGSRKHPHLNCEQLQEALDGQGIRYRWIEALGGLAEGGCERHVRKSRLAQRQLSQLRRLHGQRGISPGNRNARPGGLGAAHGHDVR
jgi:uncharacterized protein (DUF488 family)